jgi:hypothetical protein
VPKVVACDRCEEEFTQRKRGQRFCSFGCATKSRDKRETEHIGGDRHVCRCGKTFHTVSAGRKLCAACFLLEVERSGRAESEPSSLESLESREERAAHSGSDRFTWGERSEDAIMRRARRVQARINAEDSFDDRAAEER